MEEPTSPGSFLDLTNEEMADTSEAKFDTLRPEDRIPSFAEVTAEGAWMEDSVDPPRPLTASCMLGGPSLGMGASLMSSTDVGDSRTRMSRNRSQSRSKLSRDGRCNSAPLLPASQSTHASTWYSVSGCPSTVGGGSRNSRNGDRTLWKPLASSWRDWDSDEFGPARKNVDDSSAFRDGCMPHWGKHANIRKNTDLEHELATAYMRIKRHVKHKCRKEVGDPLLPKDAVVLEMRSGKDKQFQFWRDLRPPFCVLGVHKLQDEPWSQKHPDGILHEIVYECGIDYRHERMWNEKSENGTFNNKIHSTAKVRIPDGYPRQRPLNILNWGEPKLNWTPGDDMDDDGNPLRPVFINPSKWMPISQELEQRADKPRFAACRESTRRADSRRGMKTNNLQKVLLGPHPSLQKLASIDQNLCDMTAEQQRAKEQKILEETGMFPPKKVMPRKHRIFTAAAGFVTYAG